MMAFSPETVPTSTADPFTPILFAQELSAFVSAYFTELPKVALEARALAPYLNQDKKNLDNQWRYAALKSPGAYLLNQSFELAQLEAVLQS
jgi:hypothetical protein